MTESEKLFLAFCEDRKWPIKRLEPPGPDFCVTLADRTGLVVEVKEYTPNKEEQAAERPYEAGKPAIYGTTPGKRLRGKINRANKQFKVHGGHDPTMLVTYNCTVNRQYDRSYDVLTAMRGLDTISIAVPKDPREPPVSGPIHPGPGKKMTADINTSTSAIGVLLKFWPLQEFWSDSARSAEHPEYNLIVYHNRFAKYPLDPSLLVDPLVKHLRMSEDEMGWQEHPSKSS